MFWYLKITVLLSFELASWPPNLQTMAKSPKMFWSTWKYPSPYSESQVHMLVCFQPTCEPNTCCVEKRERNQGMHKKLTRMKNSTPWIRDFIDKNSAEVTHNALQQFHQNKNVIPTLPLRSQTSRQGISSTGKPARVMVFRCKGWVFSYPSQSTVRSTFSNKVRYDGARELLGSQFSLIREKK